MERDDVLIEVDNLYKYFPISGGLIRRKLADVKAVDGISFYIKRGETLGLVGESGCGKTTTGRCILQLDKVTSGKVFFEGKDLSKLSRRELRNMRRNMQLIFQDAYTFASLDPRMTAGAIIGEPMLVHNLVKGKELDKQVAELLTLVALEPYMAKRYPHEFSAGQQQRIDIARALAVRPSFIVCDNPVSSLDVSSQAQIIALLTRLKEERGMSYLFIAHDLAVVRNISDRVAVMYLGKIMEMADSDKLYDNPRHPYTQALLSAVPIPDPVVARQRKPILLAGEVPSAINPPSGCRLHPRCERAFDLCMEQVPELESIGHDHWVACHRV